ncbi:MAG TPA: alpha/beta fold hydrolase [Acidimicrobiales bacterium]|nr:alpha/beta fold hydrolase [Acidimicrobiales bacterium]
MADGGDIADIFVEGTGGVRLHLRGRALDAAGIPVLLVHGLASNAALWDGVAAHLAALGHPVAAVDQRGHGRSAKPDTGYDFATVTSDLVAVASALGWQPASDRRPVVAGQSWGGNVALELAARHPQAARALVLVDGGTIELVDQFADWPTCRAALTPPNFNGTTVGRLRRMLRAAHPDWPPEGIEGTLANFEVLPDGRVSPWLDRRHHMEIVRHMWDHRPSERYPRIGVPVMLIPAEADSVPSARWMGSKRDQVARAEKALPVSLTRWIRGDHDLHAQHPAEVADLVHAAADPSTFNRS